MIPFLDLAGDKLAKTKAQKLILADILVVESLASFRYLAWAWLSGHA